MQTRRDALRTGLVAVGALGTGTLATVPAHAFTKPAFEAKTVQEAVKALGGTSLAESKDVAIQGPDIAENGAVVPLGGSTSLAGIRQLALLVEKNPNVLVAVFGMNDALEPNFATRAKLGQSSDVYAVAIGGDGKAFFAKKEIKVTLGGCGG
ncbi:MAG: thiosulfate oxidation carrier protein SoxY [Burkholderiales bacterium]|nr:thiosulfate oxidation carrier protein SoxY [Burkholderiales bacterium]